MSILNVSGIQFGDNTTLFSKYGIIPKDSVMLFYQAIAPTGWTKLTSHDNKALRVVSGTGGGFGYGGTAGPGGIDFTTAFPSSPKTFSGDIVANGTVGDTTLTTDQLPSHAHAAGSAVTVSPGAPGTEGRLVNSNAPNTGLTGGGLSHTHPFVGSPSPFSSTLDLRLQYIDVILCSFN